MTKHPESQQNRDCFGQFCQHGFCPAEEVCHFRQKRTDCMLQCQGRDGFSEKWPFVQVCGLDQVQICVLYVQICGWVGGCVCVWHLHFLVFLEVSCSSFGIPWTLCRLVGARMRTSVPVKLSSIGVGSVRGSLWLCKQALWFPDRGSSHMISIKSTSSLFAESACMCVLKRGRSTTMHRRCPKNEAATAFLNHPATRHLENVSWPTALQEEFADVQRPLVSACRSLTYWAQKTILDQPSCGSTNLRPKGAQRLNLSSGISRRSTPSSVTRCWVHWEAASSGVSSAGVKFLQPAVQFLIVEEVHLNQQKLETLRKISGIAKLEGIIVRTNPLSKSFQIISPLTTFIGQEVAKQLPVTTATFSTVALCRACPTQFRLLKDTNQFQKCQSTIDHTSCHNWRGCLSVVLLLQHYLHTSMSGGHQQIKRLFAQACCQALHPPPMTCL